MNSGHLLWSGVELGLRNGTMRRTLQALEWMSRGMVLQLGGRTIAMTSTTTGVPIFAYKAEMTDSDCPSTEYVALGTEADLSILYSLVKEVNAVNWDKLVDQAEKAGL